MSEIKTYRHPVTNRIKRTDREDYARIAGFEPWDGEIEIDKVGVQTADLSLVELRELAREQGLPTSGNKAELQSRLAEAAATPNASSTPAGDTKE